MKLVSDDVCELAETLIRKSLGNGKYGYTEGQCERLLDWLIGKYGTKVIVDVDITCPNALLVCNALDESLLGNVIPPEVTERINDIRRVAEKYDGNTILATKFRASV